MMLEGIKWAMGVTKADVTPKPFPGKAASPKPGGLPEGPGKALVENVCGTCHSVESPSPRADPNGTGRISSS